MSRRKILGDRYRIGEVLGQGAFATVYECVDIESSQRYAVKVLNKTVLRQQGMEEAFEREIAAMKALRASPHVTNLVEVLQSSRNYYLVMEIADGGTLLTMIAKNGGLPRHVLKKYFRQLVVGLRDIHQSGVVHRDIKPDNLLLDEYRDLRIADFSFAACANDSRVLKRQCGSPHYVAPEVIIGNGYNGRKVDVWSLGVTLYAMAFGQMPFVAPNTDLLYERICAGHLTFPKEADGTPKGSEALRHLISVCLAVDPAERWTLKKIFRHPWLQGHEQLPRKGIVGPGLSPEASAIGATNSMDLGNVESGFQGLGSTGELRLSQEATLPNNIMLGGSVLSPEAHAAVIQHAQCRETLPTSNSCPVLRCNAFALGGGEKAGANLIADGRRKGIRRHYSKNHVAEDEAATEETAKSSGPSSSGATDQRGATNFNPKDGDGCSFDAQEGHSKSFLGIDWYSVHCIFNLICVSAAVVIVGISVLLFNINVAKLPLPVKVKDFIEKALTPPQRKRTKSTPSTPATTRMGLCPHSNVPMNSSKSLDSMDTSAPQTKVLNSNARFSSHSSSTASPPNIAGPSPTPPPSRKIPVATMRRRPSQESMWHESSVRSHDIGGSSGGAVGHSSSAGVALTGQSINDDDITSDLMRGSLTYEIGDWNKGIAKLNRRLTDTNASLITPPSFDDFDFSAEVASTPTRFGLRRRNVTSGGSPLLT